MRVATTSTQVAAIGMPSRRRIPLVIQLERPGFAYARTYSNHGTGRWGTAGASGSLISSSLSGARGLNHPSHAIALGALYARRFWKARQPKWSVNGDQEELR